MVYYKQEKGLPFAVPFGGKNYTINTLYPDWASGCTTTTFSVVKQYVDLSDEVISERIFEPF